jgi:hypothetical protein
MSRYFVVGELAGSEAEVIRIAGLLRGTESAVQAVSVSSPFLHPVHCLLFPFLLHLYPLPTRPPALPLPRPAIFNNFPLFFSPPIFSSLTQRTVRT